MSLSFLFLILLFEYLIIALGSVSLLDLALDQLAIKGNSNVWRREESHPLAVAAQFASAAFNKHLFRKLPLEERERVLREHGGELMVGFFEEKNMYF